MNHSFLSGLIVSTIATIASQAQATIWYVDGDGGDPGNGCCSSAVACTSWADACSDLQTVMDLAGAGDQIWVAAWTYKPDQGSGQTPGDRTATFDVQSGVALYGGFAGGETMLSQRDIAANPTILSGDLGSDDNPSGPPGPGGDCCVATGPPGGCSDNACETTVIAIRPSCSSDWDALCARIAQDTCCTLCSQNTTFCDNSLHVVTATQANVMTVDGFTVRSGYANVHGSGASICFGDDVDGGGIYIGNGNATVRNCRLENNTSACRGGATYYGSHAGSSAQPVFEDCQFTGNVSGDGGAIRGQLSPGLGSLTLLHCSFQENSAVGPFGAGGALQIEGGMVLEIDSCTFIANVANQGGAIYLANAGTLARIIRCQFQSNSADQGGAIKVFDNAQMIMTNCRLQQNTAILGAGAFHSGSNSTVVNSIFNANLATLGVGRSGSGGAMYNVNSDPLIVNCVFFGNVAGSAGGGINNATLANPTIFNSIVWANLPTSNQIQNDKIPPGGATAEYSLVQGGYDGVGNIDVPPVFVGTGTEDGDFHLAPGSPCIDAADNVAVPTDTADVDGDGDVAERVPVDFEGYLRFVDDIATRPDLGVPDPPNYPHVIDMGAYEFGSGPDCNNNLIPDQQDIASCPPATPACDDCNDNGVLDECDLAGLDSADCNTNDIPDECDIANCDPDMDPSCDDCNLNGVPDGCDIASMTSDDADMDGLPDECAQFVGGCPLGQANLWSCPQNWILEDPGDDYPDSTQFGGPFHVILDDVDEAILDVAAAIDTLLLRDAAVLHVTDADPATNLTLVNPAGILNEGLLRIGNGSLVIPRIDILNGTMRIQNGGTYEADPEAPIPTQGLLQASGVTIAKGCSGVDGSAMTLTGLMEVVLNGDLVLEGDDGDDPGKCEPELAVHGNAAASAVDLVLQGDVSVTYDSTEPLILSGDFINHTTSPEEFDWVNGVIEFVSDGGPAPLLQDHFLEVAAVDMGASPLPAAGDKLFLIGGITVASGNRLTVRNQIAPVGRAQSSCSEALYVGRLHIDDGAELVADNVKIYHQNLIEDGLTTSMGCGALLDLLTPVCGLVAICGDADGNGKRGDGKRDDPCAWYSCSAGQCDSVPRGFGNGGQYGQADLGSPAGPGACNVDGVADGNDRFHALNCFSNANFGAPGDYPCEPDSPNALNVDAGSSASCVLDGVCDGNDAFHALNSFANANFGVPGGYPCACSGPAPAGGKGTGTYFVDEVDSLDGNASQSSRVFPQEYTGLVLRAPRHAWSGELVHVDIHLTSGLAALRGYQLHLTTAGGTGGAPQLVDISIDAARDDYVFAGVPGVWSAFNRTTGQMLAGMDAAGGVPASAEAYLATFTYHLPKDASGTFVVDVRAGDGDPSAQDRTFLFGAYARPIGVKVRTPVRVVIEADVRRTRQH